MYFYGSEELKKIGSPNKHLSGVPKKLFDKFGFKRLTNKNGQRYCIVAKVENDETSFEVYTKKEKHIIENLPSNYIVIKDFDTEEVKDEFLFSN